MNKIILALIISLSFSCNTPSETKSGSPEQNSNEKPNTDSKIQAVIEIPAGTLDKFELNKNTHKIEHEHKDGKPRVVQYLAYPGNYGYIPNTRLSKENGGDGDPLDVLVLGAAVERNDTIPIQIIGALKLLDKGEQDDKLIAVSANTPFSEIQSLKQLEREFPGTKSIIEIWFSNYKGKMKSQGFIGSKHAFTMLNLAQQDYKNSH